MICTSVTRKNDSHETRAGDTIIETCSALMARNKLCLLLLLFSFNNNLFFFFLVNKEIEATVHMGCSL